MHEYESVLSEELFFLFCFFFFLTIFHTGSDDGCDDEFAEDPAPIIAVRSNFNPLANFTPAIQVAEDGTAQLPVKIPDNLTRYRSPKMMLLLSS